MYKFKPGDRVRIRPASHWERDAPARIVRPVPLDESGPHYRVRSEQEEFERIVPENRLEPLPGDAAFR